MSYQGTQADRAAFDRAEFASLQPPEPDFGSYCDHCGYRGCTDCAKNAAEQRQAQIDDNLQGYANAWHTAGNLANELADRYLAEHLDIDFGAIDLSDDGIANWLLTIREIDWTDRDGNPYPLCIHAAREFLKLGRGE